MISPRSVPHAAAALPDSLPTFGMHRGFRAKEAVPQPRRRPPPPVTPKQTPGLRRSLLLPQKSSPCTRQSGMPPAGHPSAMPKCNADAHSRSRQNSSAKPVSADARQRRSRNTACPQQSALPAAKEFPPVSDVPRRIPDRARASKNVPALQKFPSFPQASRFSPKILIFMEKITIKS